ARAIVMREDRTRTRAPIDWFYMLRADLSASVCASLAAGSAKPDAMDEVFWERARMLSILPRTSRTRFAWASLSLTAAAEHWLPGFIVDRKIAQLAIREAIRTQLPAWLLA